MTVLHTPILGPTVVTDRLCSVGRGRPVYESRAGIKSGELECSNQSQHLKTDMGNSEENHGTPNLKSLMKMDKSPSVMDNRMEQFGNIAGMITLWKEMEEGGKDDHPHLDKGGGGSDRIRRRSRGFQELQQIFEGNIVGSHEVEPENNVTLKPEIIGEGGRVILNKEFLEQEGVDRVDVRAAYSTKTANIKSCLSPANEKSRVWETGSTANRRAGL